MAVLNLKDRDLVSIKDLSKEEIERVLSVAEEMEPIAEGKKASNLLAGKVLATLFFEPSTRTQFSFQVAMSRLGGAYIGMADTKVSSIAKGEDFYDTIKMMDGYADIIAIRHPKAGSAREAADIAAHPVINGGDGANEHPTQALLDLYTVKKEKGRIEGVKIALFGDIRHARSYHSLIPLFGMFRAELNFVSPKELDPPEKVVAELKRDFNLEVRQYRNIMDVIKEVDVIRLVRVQKERFPSEEEYQKVKSSYVVNLELLKHAKKDVIVMHGLPRIDELDRRVDDTPHAAYFRQAFNGVPIRMALLSLFLGAR
ncbi:MAG: aspartate carbamoyltransferase [Deltaproteobacteria bacterium RBG_13_53_10]|nr:MAG: aspartate carbamoyltransferase [Deltaproteobacteria bacterium RBG_13_53_10]